MSGFGAKIVPAKTWGFNGAKIECFGNSGCPPRYRKDSKWGTKNTPQTHQIEPKGDLEAPSRASLHSKWCLITIVRFIIENEGLWELWGSAGEVKNDTERPQDRENNVLEAESKIRHSKNHKHSRKKFQKSSV